MTLPLPTRANAAVLFLDLQSEIVTNSRTVPLVRLRARAAALAKLAALHSLPAFESSVPPGADFLPDVLDALPDVRPRPRMQTSAFADDDLVEQLRTSGRTILVLSGVATEIVVARRRSTLSRRASTCTLRSMLVAASIRGRKMRRDAA